MTINERLKALRNLMAERKIDAVIIPSSDPHQSEYVADHWKCREWISGFTGSAGTAVVTFDHAGLWTDSRYFLQAEEELSHSEFELHKVLNYSPDFVPFLKNQLKQGAKVSCDGNIFSHNEMLSMRKDFEELGIDVESSFDMLGDVWLERPSIPLNEVIAHDPKYSGRTLPDKLGLIRSYLKESGADHYLLCTLDDIAWTFNLRGSDIECNPVFISYALISMDGAKLFIDSSKVSAEIRKKLKNDGVELYGYDHIFKQILAIDSNETIYLTASTVNYKLYTIIGAKVMEGKNQVAFLKSCKTDTEIKHYRKAMEKDGVALLKLYRWLESELDASNEPSEYEVAMKLATFRSQQEGYYGESFAAIVGYAANGAIVHYRPLEESCSRIKKEGILLLDSGGQYMDGTTDITRTTALGPASEEQKRNFTLVLKGHIAVDQLEFPKGTNGYQLDSFARQFMWKYGLNYFHGTGHGVGFFLNVHEGPQGISFVWSERSNTPLESGMVTSNEPGYYKTDEYGIRIENLIVARESKETEFGIFYKHETLTLFPIDLQLIDQTLLSRGEVEWLNDYHSEVFMRLSKYLNDSERIWLEDKCRQI